MKYKVLRGIVSILSAIALFFYWGPTGNSMYKLDTPRKFKK